MSKDEVSPSTPLITRLEIGLLLLRLGSSALPPAVRNMLRFQYTGLFAPERGWRISTYTTSVQLKCN